ncbi:hypothetical protein tpqmel_0683 [Candidatus Gastranaerophilus sp. (ex Termes propinquus)]|nr:hypothetical protein tpqmel_0683 [Candidatus Gastranaerophilus sp. (ex Termes propinquus)]
MEKIKFFFSGFLIYLIKNKSPHKNPRSPKSRAYEYGNMKPGVPGANAQIDITKKARAALRAQFKNSRDIKYTPKTTAQAKNPPSTYSTLRLTPKIL